jgi:hypothetical protein
MNADLKQLLSFPMYNAIQSMDYKRIVVLYGPTAIRTVIPMHICRLPIHGESRQSNSAKSVFTWRGGSVKLVEDPNYLSDFDVRCVRIKFPK